MHETKIAFNNIESIPQLVKDFLDEKIPEFVAQKFSLKNALKQSKIKQKSFSESQRQILCEVLKSQLSRLELSEKQKENLQLLSQENTFTVTTGHQLNLFSGPVFFVYKILQTIKIADFLNKNSKDKKFVPVFWLATEDHDFEEINHFKTQENFYQIFAKPGGAVGRISVEKNNFIEDFEKEFKDEIYGTELILMLKEAYKKGNTLTEAIKILVNRLFSEYGLLMIDGDDAALKSQMKSIFEDELRNQTLKNATLETVKFLENSYGKVQVNPREINLFYLSDTRNRIEFDGEQYQIVDKNLTFTLEELLQNVEKLSPNVVMRPIYQEKILPNIAYIGGNAEIMYWLELGNYFKKLEIPLPLLVPRNSILFLTEKMFGKIEKSGLLISDFFSNFQEKLNEKLVENSEILEILNQKEEILKENFHQIKSKAEITDKTFGNLVNAEEKRQIKSYKRMKKRLLKAEKIKQSEQFSYWQNLYLQIHPRGSWQERVLNFSVFYAENGKIWLQNCYQQLSVENSELIILQN